MINALGKKRLVIIFLLLGVIAVVAVINFFVLEPQKVSLSSKLSGLTTEISRLQGDIEKMKADEIVIKEQKDIFERLTLLGFLSGQDRSEVKDTVSFLQNRSKLVSTKFEVLQAVALESEEASTDSIYATMISPIKFNITALDDSDIYKFIYFINYGLPAYFIIDRLLIEHKGEVTESVLKEIGSGNPMALVEAEIEIRWISFLKKDQIPNDLVNPQPSAAGGNPQ